MPLDISSKGTEVARTSVKDVREALPTQERGQPGEGDDRVAPQRMAQRNDCGVESGNNSDVGTTSQ